MNNLPALALSGALICLPLWSRAAQPPPAAQLTVVELFTSQGCSSCPPADALLSELAKRPDVLPLAFHVDYWDSLGWRDPFALRISAQRQQRYVSKLGLANGFTPQSIVDGQLSLVGSDRRRLLAAIDIKRPRVLLELNISDHTLRVALNTQPESAHHDRYDVLAIAYLTEASTLVSRGENGGRTLREFNIVRSVQQLGTWDGQAARFQLPVTSLPSDASKVAVLLQHSGQGAIAGAAFITLH